MGIIVGGIVQAAGNHEQLPELLLERHAPEKVLNPSLDRETWVPVGRQAVLSGEGDRDERETEEKAHRSRKDTSLAESPRASAAAFPLLRWTARFVGTCMPHIPPAPPPTSPRWRRRHWYAVLAILLLALSLGWWSRPPEIGTALDDANYVALSYSLEKGRYHDEFLLGAPPHGKYPPGTALWIAAIRQVAGPDLDAVRLGNLLLLALTATLIGTAVCRLGGAWLGVGAVAATAFNLTLIRVAGELYSEMPFIALATVAIWATLIADEDSRRRWPLLAGVTAVAAFLTRLMGVALLPAILVWALVRRRWTTAACLGLVSAVTVGGWMLLEPACRRLGGRRSTMRVNGSHASSAEGSSSAPHALPIGSCTTSSSTPRTWIFRCWPSRCFDTLRWTTCSGCSCLLRRQSWASGCCCGAGPSRRSPRH